MTQRQLHYLIQHFDHRLLELQSACMMIGLGIHIFIWPDAIGASAFRFMLQLMSPVTMMVLFMVGGLLRLVALIANGNWPRHGYKLRVAGAIFGAVLWSQMCLALFLLIPKVGTPPSPGITVYGFLTLFELIAIALVLVKNVRRPD